MGLFGETQTEVEFVIAEKKSEGAGIGESFPESKTPFAQPRDGRPSSRFPVSVDIPGSNERYMGPHELVYLSSRKIKGKFPEIADKEHLSNFAEGIANLTDLVTQYQIDTLLFLDKSARPISYLFRKSWDRLFEGEEGPDIRFIDIGQGSYETAKNLSPEALQEIKSRYSGCIDGRRVLIVDEYVESGSSLQAAREIIQALFPEAEHVYATAFSPTTPKWYGKREKIGVANAHEYLEEYGYYAKDPSQINTTPSFISSTLPGALGEIKMSPEGVEAMSEEKIETFGKSIKEPGESQKLRTMLDIFVEEVVPNLRKVPQGTFRVTPFLPDSLEDKNIGLLKQ